MIIEKKLEGFDDKLKFDKLNYPQCSCGQCPKFYWNTCGYLQHSYFSTISQCLDQVRCHCHCSESAF